jgi:hypothetical protein
LLKTKSWTLKLALASSILLANAPTASADLADELIRQGVGILLNELTKPRNPTTKPQQVKPKPKQKSANQNGKQKLKPDQAAKAPARPAVSIEELARVKDIQTRLNQLGFDVGTPDGISGRKTRNAIIAFQMANGLDQSGVMDNEAVALLVQKTSQAANLAPAGATSAQPVTQPAVATDEAAAPAAGNQTAMGSGSGGGDGSNLGDPSSYDWKGLVSCETGGGLNCERSEDASTAIESIGQFSSRDQTDPSRLVALGEKLNDSKSQNYRPADAAQLFKQAAELGDPIGMNRYANELLFGGGVEIDEEAGVKWHEIAASKGNEASMNALGRIYAYGLENLERNVPKSLEFYTKAASLGSPTAMFDLGKIYYEDVLVPKDAKSAARWFQKAAEAGHVEGAYWFGVVLSHGEGVKENDKDAVFWFQKAAEGAFPRAMVAMAHAYENGEGVRKSAVEALAWFKKAAEAGSVSGGLDYAWRLQQGIGAKPNAVEADAVLQNLRYLDDGVENFLESMKINTNTSILIFELSDDYYAGKRGKKQREKELRYTRQAHFYLKWNLHAGRDLPIDFNTGTMLFLGMLMEDERFPEANKREAARLYRLAAENGDKTGMKQLADMLRSGDGIEMDVEEAQYWKERAK